MRIRSRGRARDLILSGAALAHSGRDYSRALYLLQGGLGAPATSSMINNRRFLPLIADGYDSLGHVARELGKSRRWAADFHFRAANLWQQCGDAEAAALAQISGAHCLESVDTPYALSMLSRLRATSIYVKNSTIHVQVENRFAETLALQGDAKEATHIARDIVVPFIEWNPLNAEWAAIALIAAAKFCLRTNGPDSSLSILDFARANFAEGIQLNDVILTDFLGVETAAFLTSSDLGGAESSFKRMALISARNGYPIREHVEHSVLERLRDLI